MFSCDAFLRVVDPADPLRCLSELSDEVLSACDRRDPTNGPPGDTASRVRRVAEVDTRTAVVEACAAARQAVHQVLGVDLHRSQVMAGAALCCGWTVQMGTGEGKTFAAVAPSLLYGAVAGSAHVVTANSYLAERDARWVGAALESLGLSVAASLPGQSRLEKQAAYRADVVFGEGAEFGFDYLRDCLFLPEDVEVQKARSVAIVDEADAVLVDNARTPLILSGSVAARADLLRSAEQTVRRLRVGVDVSIDAEHRDVELTDAGVTRCEELLGIENLFAPSDANWPYLLPNALRARVLLFRDRDYIVVGDHIQVVDELTGRTVEGRRWSEGLHQAVEAKEELPISADRTAVGRITQSAYFSQYELVVGMSGTLEGVDRELETVYGTRTVAIPTHRPVIRHDHPDTAFPTKAEKFEAVADGTARRSAAGQPVLVGTRSIDDTRAFSRLLAARRVLHQTLTAEDDAREAAIIAEAGRRGSVTVATQMAGRGVDIVLGGATPSQAERSEVVAAGGLFVWGLEHHPSVRLDMQLRGRSGRQGDPGASRFAVSDEDDLAQLGSPELDTCRRAESGQLVAERLDAELRDDVRKYETVVDALHERLYAWRRKVANAHYTAPMLDDVVGRSGRLIEHDDMAVAGTPTTGLPRRERKRQQEIARRVAARLDERRREVGGDIFLAAARLILQTLLLRLWPQTLEELDQQMRLARAAAFPTIHNWERAAHQIYDNFARTASKQWIMQLAAFRVTEHLPPAGSPEWTEPPASEGPATHEPGGATEDLYLVHWHWRPSFNRWARKHFGIWLPEPPLVLVVDAIGEDARSNGLRLHLDLQQPENTVLTLG